LSSKIRKIPKKIVLPKEGKKRDRDFGGGLMLGMPHENSAVESGRKDRHINAENVHSWGSENLTRLADFLNRFFSAVNASAGSFVDPEKGSFD